MTPRVALVLAWIAWSHSVFLSEGIDKWEAAGATDSLDECKRAAVTSAQNVVRRARARDTRGTVYVQDGMTIEITFPSGKKASTVFVCLPETIDPRERKKE